MLKPDIFTRPEAVLSLQVAGQTFGTCPLKIKVSCGTDPGSIPHALPFVRTCSEAWPHLAIWLQMPAQMGPAFKLGSNACMVPADVEQVAGGRTSRQEVLAPGTSALQLSAGLQAVSSNAGPALEFHRADFAMMPGCSDACMEALLEVCTLCCYSLCSNQTLRARSFIFATLVCAILLQQLWMHPEQRRYIDPSQSFLHNARSI